MGILSRLSWLKRPRLVIPLTITALVIAAVILAIHNLNSPAVGSVTAPATSIKPTALPTMPPAKNYNDKYLSFQYPGSFKIAAPDKNSGYLDTVKLIGQPRNDIYASVAIFRGDLTSNSGVMYRKLHPDLYKVVSATPLTYVFQKTDGQEYTGFLARASYLVSVSFTSVSASNLAADYSMVSNSLQLKE